METEKAPSSVRTQLVCDKRSSVRAQLVCAKRSSVRDLFFALA